MVINNIGKIKQKLISAKEIIEKFNVTYQTVNHYTNFDLLHVVIKNGNVRMYNEVEVREKLMKISQLIGEGYPLRLIRKKLDGEE